MQLDKPNEFVGMPVFAELQTIMEQIFHKIPSISFEANDWETFPSEADQFEREKRIAKVRVFNANEYVGQLRVVRENYRNQGTMTVYRVNSPRIENRISPKNTKTTTNAGQALRAALKHFAHTASPDEAISKAKETMAREMSNMSYTANRNVERMGDNYETQLVELAFAVHRGEAFDMNKIAKVLNHKDADKLIDTRRIVHSVKDAFNADSGLIVREERDGTLTAIDMSVAGPSPSKISRVADSYGLPELYQPKLAMLRMLDYKQAVDSIGVKFSIENTNWYYLAAGEIITTS
jgi:hypothetical protein